MIDGMTLTNQKHEQSLTRALDRVQYVMEQGGWWTYWELQQRIWKLWNQHYSETCISARIRDLRKPQNGGRVVDRRKRYGTQATFEYRLLPEAPLQEAA